MSVLACVMLSLALSACASGMQRTRVPAAGIDPALLRKAGPLPPAESGLLPALIKNHLQVAQICNARGTQLNALIDTVTEPVPPPWWKFWEIYF